MPFYLMNGDVRVCLEWGGGVNAVFVEESHRVLGLSKRGLLA